MRFGTIKPQTRRVPPRFAHRVLAGGGELARPDRGPAGGVLYLECANLFGALPAARADLPDGGAASVSLFNEPQVRHPSSAHRLARRNARPAGSAGRRIFPIQIE